MVVLITFLFSIYDLTRLQLIQLEASSNFDMASEVALSQYDPVLFHQYGLFAGSQGIELESVFQECLETQFYPDKAKKHTYLLDYYLSDPDEGLRFKVMEPVGYNYSINYNSLIDCSYKHPKQQILDYMKLREPYLMIKPFLGKLDILAKSSKSASVIEEKNELISSFKSIESYKLKLYELVDGIKVNYDGSWNYIEVNPYVRAFSYADELDYTYYPNHIVSQFRDKVRYLDQELQVLSVFLNRVDQELYQLLNNDPYSFIYIHNDETDEEQLVGVVMNETAKVAFEALQELQSSYEGYDELIEFLNGVMSANQDALHQVQELEALCISNIDDINEFQNRLESKDALIESVVTEINAELNTVKEEIDLNGMSVNRSDNLSLIKTQLTDNIAAIGQGLIYLEAMNDTMGNYIYRRYLYLKTGARIDNEQVDMLNDAMEAFEEGGISDPVNISTILNLKTFAQTHIKGYKSDVIFDYSMLDEIRPEHNEYEDKESSLLDIDLGELFNTNGVIGNKPVLNIDESILPSIKFDPNRLSVVDFSKMDRGIKEVKNLDLSMDGLVELASNAHDTVLINEYAVGMFSNVSRSNNPNAKSINGYKLSEHFLEYETEYIISGHLDEQKNMDVVLRYLYGSRMTLNLIHLAMDHTKRTVIMNLANAIAGWWTGGVGAIIIAIIIAAAWALLESVADVFMLISGERVPIIKTRSSWYTSLDGNIIELFNGSVQRLENEFILYMEETNSNIDDGIDRLKQFVAINSNLTSSEDFQLVNSYIDELHDNIKGFGEEVGLGIEGFDLSVDSELDSYIDNKLKSELQNNHQTSSNPFADESGKDLIISIDHYIDQEIAKVPEGELNLEHIITIKENAVEAYKYQIYLYKQDHKNEVVELFDDAVKLQIDVLEESISELMSKGTKIGRKHIVDKADAIKDEFLDEASEVQQQSKLEMFIPSFSYEDYLRVFLLLPIVDEDTKIARIMDLIQLNNQKEHNDYELTLNDYYIGIEVSGNVAVRTMFIPNIEGKQINNVWELGVFDVKKNY